MFDIRNDKLKGLDGIVSFSGGNISPSRIYKTITKTKSTDKVSVDFYISCLEKINYCIQDLNEELKIINSDSYSRKDITYIILCVTWIKESFWNIRKDLVKEISKEIKKDKLQDYREFIEAFRSFSVAHPMDTDKHTKYGMDGTVINVDLGKIKGNVVADVFFDFQDSYQLCFDGLKKVSSIKTCDFYFKVYRKNGDKAKFASHIGCNFSDLYEVAQAYIDKLYEIDLLIRRLARKHII